ncbi:hypothetical protein ACFYWS_20730 [Streptomyces sp. NPDC002795]|uniref:hypothetical protein n=1 Tax=Streptomyces sp. NPDC002795 TaxID=3364665 RepID=UPI0036B0C684
MDNTEPRPLGHYIVVFRDEPISMRIVAVEPAPTDYDDDATLRAEMWVAGLGVYDVRATGERHACNLARLIHDVERIREVRARARRPRRTPPCTPLPTGANSERVRTLVRAMLLAAWHHRPLGYAALTFDQYLQVLRPRTITVLTEHAALCEAGRRQQAVALVVHALDNAA